MLVLPVAPKSEKQLAREAATMTCQCCGRGILANTGTIAHHGYQRPGGGWQTASCSGSKYQPFEVSRDRLGDLIVSLKQWKQRQIETRRQIAAEEIAIVRQIKDRTQPRYLGEYPVKNLSVTRGNFNAIKTQFGIRFVDFDDLLKQELNNIDHSILEVTREIDFQQNRYDNWKPVAVKFNRSTKEWEKQ